MVNTTWVIDCSMTAELALRKHLSQKGLLDRFESRAIDWAEKAGIRWIELEGELWTLVTELERKKGVQAGDFVRDSGLQQAHEVKPHEAIAGLQRLLQVPGVKRACIPTAFQVEGGYSLSCGGPGAKLGITAMVRQQVPEWALSGYTLVNLPLALSYLMHGRSEIAKATRDLTIGTVVDVGKAASSRENAPMALLPFADGLSKSQQAFLHLLQTLQEETKEATDLANRAEIKADDAKVTAITAYDTANMALTLVQSQYRSKPKAKQPTKRTRELLFRTKREHYKGLCPCCYESVDDKNLEIDHWSTRNNAEPVHLWLVCGGCNIRLGMPEHDGGKKRTDLDRKRFTTFQQLMGLPEVVQPNLGISA